MTTPVTEADVARLRLAELFYHADGFLHQFSNDEIMPDAPVWIEAALGEEHCGDCTGVPASCMRCHAEDVLKVANWVADRWPNTTSGSKDNG